MTLTERNTFILDIQGKLATYGGKLSDALNIGKCTDKMKKNSILSHLLLKVLYRFDAENEDTTCITEEDFCRIKNKILTLIK